MAIIKKSANSKCWRGCGESITLLHCWWECELVQTLWRTVWGFIKKLKIELPLGYNSLTLGHECPEKKQTHSSKEYMHRRVHCGTVCNGQDVGAT